MGTACVIVSDQLRPKDVQFATDKDKRKQTRISGCETQLSKVSKSHSLGSNLDNCNHNYNSHNALGDVDNKYNTVTLFV